MRMPFGKFKGRAVDDLPREYLEWLASIDLREPLASAVEAALDDAENSLPARSAELPAELRPVAQELISVGFRALALKLHPDHGGTHAEMTKLNAARDWLREQTA